MKISTKGRYALRMLLDLAEHRQCGYIALKDIAERQNISKKYLEQIIPMFNNSGILKTSRGAQGGYQLAKSPDSYTAGGDSPLDGGLAGAGFVRRAGAGRLRAQRGLRAASGLAGDSIARSARIWTASRCKRCWTGRRSAAPTITRSEQRTPPAFSRTAENAGGRRYSANIG